LIQFYQIGKFFKTNYQSFNHYVTVLGDDAVAKAGVKQIESDLIWYEEFLDYKIVIESTTLIKKQSKNKQILWRSFGFHHHAERCCCTRIHGKRGYGSGIS
jgi:hypothetical protein